MTTLEMILCVVALVLVFLWQINREEKKSALRERDDLKERNNELRLEVERSHADMYRMRAELKDAKSELYRAQEALDARNAAFEQNGPEYKRGRDAAFKEVKKYCELIYEKVHKNPALKIVSEYVDELSDLPF